MSTSNGKNSPSRLALKISNFKAEKLTSAESTVIEKHMRALPRIAIDPNCSEQSLNLMMAGCLDELLLKKHDMFTSLDINKPEAGGVKFQTFKEKVISTMEELGAQQHDLGSSLQTAEKQPKEEDK